MRNVITHRMAGLLRKCWWLFPDDKRYLELMYALEMGQRLNLEQPKLYQEKLQWLKLYYRKPEYVAMVDKVTAKSVAEKIIGPQYIIPTLGTWDSFDEIDFQSLPKQFVLKTSNGGGSGGVVVCKDKSRLDIAAVKKKMEQSIKSNIYQKYREWPYKEIQPKLLAEQYLHDESPYNNNGLTDYKFTCFNGTADNVMVCAERESGNTKFYFYNQRWELMPLNVRGKNTAADFKLPKPACMDEMFEIAGKLSEGIPFLRVDLYCVNDRPYFGETTFFPASGFDPNILPETEIYFGDRIILPTNKIY